MVVLPQQELVEEGRLNPSKPYLVTADLDEASEVVPLECVWHDTPIQGDAGEAVIGRRISPAKNSEIPSGVS